MSGDDYLLDPRAPVDPEVAALEKALLPLKFRGGAPSERVLTVPAKRTLGPWPWVLVTTAAAAAVLLWLQWPTAALYPGCPPQTFVSKKSEVQVHLGELAVITLLPDSQLEFVHWRAGKQALFHLKRGGMHADVVPPPRVKAGFFCVNTDLAKVVDQGCSYDLLTSPDGTQIVLVHSGAVTFASVTPADGFREVFVPAGARAVVRPEGMQTPTFQAASLEVKRKVRQYDEMRRSKDQSRLPEVVKKLVAVCYDKGDTLPLWHMMQDGDPDVAKAATEGLIKLVGPPHGKATKRPVSEVWLEHLREQAW